MMEPMINKKMMELEHLEQLIKSEEEDRVDKAHKMGLY